MQPTFLCNKHANWVYEHPDMSLPHIATNELKGEMLAASGMYKQAIPFYGSAFDIAAIVNEMNEIEANEEQNARLRQKIAMVALALYRLYELAQAQEFQKGILERAFLELYPLKKNDIEVLTEAALLEAMQTEGQLVLRPITYSHLVH